MATIIKRKKNYSVVYYYEPNPARKSKNGRHLQTVKMPTNGRSRLRTNRNRGFLSLLHHKHWKIFYTTS